LTKIIFLITLLLVFSAASLKAQTINPPNDLEARSEDTSYIEVNWDDNSSNEEGFFIERGERNDSIEWEIIDVVPQNVDDYYDYWVTRGIKYYYRTFAYSGALRSEYSNIDSAVLEGNPGILPAPPSNLIIQDITSTSITINWQDNSSNEFGFIIARKSQSDLFFQYIDTVGMDILTYQEVGLTPDNTYLYKVCAFNNSGISDYSNTVSGRTDLLTNINISSQVPKKHYLYNNYPNPFNPTTNISFAITSSAYVKITIYNSIGKKVDLLLGKNMIPGTYSVTWNGQNYTSGIYFYELSVKGSSDNEQFTEIKKMLLIK